MVKKMRYPGLKSECYYIFDDGRIWSSYKRGFKKFTQDRYGYDTMCLRINGKDKQIPIHKLMEYNYMDMSQKKNFKDPTIDHIDSDKHNHRITNLRYLERKDNTRRGKHYKNTFYHHKLTPEDVSIIKKMLHEKCDIKIIAYFFNISSATIYQINLGHAWAWVK